MMRIAFDKTDITPSSPCHMAGYNRKEKSAGVLDPIEINTVAFEQHGELYLLGILDSIMVGREFCDQVRAQAAQRLGIPAEHITVSAIHTHSAPAFFKLTFEDTIVESELQAGAQTSMVESMVRAAGALQECTVTLEKAAIDGLYGNRNVKGGVEEKRVYLFTFFHKDGGRIGALFNISAHPTILNGSSFVLSADLLGHIRAKLQTILGCKVAITNGCCGDVSTRFYRKCAGMEELEYTANSVVEQFLEKKQPSPLSGQAVASRTFSMITHYDAATDPDWLAMTREQEAQPDSSPMKEFFLARQELKRSFGAYDLELIAQLRLFGNLLVVILPGDILSGFGLQIKNAFPELEVVILGYSNTYCNYFVPREEYGKYFETYNSRLAKGEADRFINEVITQARNLVETAQKEGRA